MRMSIVAAALAAMLVGAGANAATGSAVGTVQYVYTYGHGGVLVTGFTFSTGTCSNNSGFFIDGAHPHLKQLMALILSAKATGKTLTVVAKTDNCWYPQITADETTYIAASP